MENFVTTNKLISMKSTLLVITLLAFSGCTRNSSSSGKDQTAADLKSEEIRNLREVTLSGSGYELGFQHGKLLKNEIAELVQKWKASTRAQLGRDPDEVLKEFMVYEKFTETIKKWTPELYEEVRGIAVGSGQDFNSIYVFNLMDEFWVYLNNPEKHHCSNVGVPSVDGRTSYVAQNMDIEEFTDGYQTLIRLEQTGHRPEQLMIIHPGLIILNGMNAEGVGVVVNTIMQLNASSSGLPVAFVIRKLLSLTDKTEIIDFITSVNHASGQNYIIGIRGEVFNFEASASKVVEYNPENENGTVYHTNHPIVNNDVKPWFSEFDPTLKADLLPLQSNSYIRLASLTRRIARNDSITDETIKMTLSSKDDSENPVCRPNLNNGSGFTFASVIMTLTGKPNLQVTAGPPSESDYKTYNFD